MAALEVCLAAVSLLCVAWRLLPVPGGCLLQPMAIFSLGTQGGICQLTWTKNFSKISKQNAMSILDLLGFKNDFISY